MTGSKLGYHAQIPSNALYDLVAATKPGTVKTMFAGDDLRALMGGSPRSTFIYRHYFPEGSTVIQERVISNPQNAAVDWINTMNDADVPAGVYLETPNEFFGYDVAERSIDGRWVGGEQLGQIDIYLALCAQFATAQGWGCVVGNCGTGNLRGRWFQFMPNILRHWKDSDGRVIWGWHEYDWPNILTTDARQEPDRDNPNDPIRGQWQGLRHRRVIQEIVNEGLATPAEAARLWSIVTEFGVTQLAKQPLGQFGDYGYKRLNWDETGGVAPEQYHWYRTILAYEEAVKDEPNLLGFTHYMVGSEQNAAGPNADWRTFDLLDDPYLNNAVRQRLAAVGVSYPKQVLDEGSMPNIPDLQPFETRDAAWFIRNGLPVPPELEAPTPDPPDDSQSPELPNEPVSRIGDHLGAIWGWNNQLPEPYRQQVRDAVVTIKVALGIP